MDDVSYKQAALNYNNVINTSLEQIKAIIPKHVCKHPQYLREDYDTIFRIVERKINHINRANTDIDETINVLNNSKKTLSELEKVLKELGKISNKGRVGTLFGLCKQKIREESIPVDEIGEAVLELPYDEKKEIENFYKLIENIEVNEGANNVGEGANNVGGKNNTKRKKNIAKNANNKKSKKRRFK
jgi:hypothetical protein